MMADLRYPDFVRAIGIVGVSIFVALSSACEARLSLGSACSFESECPAALRCAGGRCREECREDRDCPGAFDSCTRFGVSGGVCTAPATAVPCGLHSDCGVGARCEQSMCRADCREDIDCVGLGACVSGLCSEPIRTPAAPGDGGTTGDCPDGRTRCAGELVCRDLGTDPGACGDCGRACPTGICRRGSCAPVNDVCETAEMLDLSSGSVRVSPVGIAAGLAGAGDSPGSCDPSPDLFFRFHLDERRLVYAVASSLSAGPIAIGLLVGCSAAPVGCVPITFGESEAVAVLDAGDYVVVLDDPEQVASSLRVYSVPIGESAPIPLELDTLSGIGSTLTLGGSTTGLTNPSVTCSTGPALAYWFRINPSGASAYHHEYTVSTCGSGAFDSTITLARGDGTATTCGISNVCGAHDDLTFTLSELTDREGLYVVFVGGATATDAGDFTLTITRGP